MKKFTVFIALICLASFPLTAQPKYVVVNLGLAGGPSTSTSALGINNAGQVTGNSDVSVRNPYRAWRTAPNSPINPATDLIPLPPGGVTSGVLWSSINSSGQVTGFSVSSAADGNIQHAFRFDTDGSVHDLGVLGGTANTSRGLAINDSGQVAGDSTAPVPPFATCAGTGGRYIFRTAANSAIVPADNLGTLLGQCKASAAWGMDNAGDAVGSSGVSVSTPEQHAVLAAPGHSMLDLGVLGVSPGATPADISSFADAINNFGQIVGSSTYNHPPSVPISAFHAFLTTATGTMQDLGTLGGNNSAATGINSTGQIVGRSTTAGELATHGFLYSGGVMYDLNNLVTGSNMEINLAFSINDRGQIVGTAGGMNGTGFAVRLDPVDGLITRSGLNVPAQRNDFNSFAGMKLTVGINPLSVYSLGRECLAGNSQTHTVKLVSASSKTDVPGAVAQVNMQSCTPGQFVYTNLPSPVTLLQGTTYYLVSQELKNGDKFYDLGGITAKSDVSVISAVYFNGVNWIAPGGANTSYVPPDMNYMTLPPPPTQAFVLDYNQNNQALRKDFTGFVGMTLKIGATPLSVTSVGRVCLAGNSQTHTVKFVNATTGVDVPGGTASVNMAGCIASQFAYTNLSAPLILQANTTYYLTSQETTGGDQWFDQGTLRTTTGASVTGAVFSNAGGWARQPGLNNSYGPPNFQYSLALLP